MAKSYILLQIEIGAHFIISQMQNRKQVGDRQELIYSNRIDKHKCYLFKVDKQFMQDLQTCEQLVLQGEPDDQLVVNSPDNSYRIKGINITTTVLVASEDGKICQQTSSYLDVQKYDPLFQQIYKQILHLSCKSPDKQSISTFAQLLQEHAFTQYSIRKQCYLNAFNFGKLSKAMNFTLIHNTTQNQPQPQYLYICLNFAVWVMRKIIQVYNGLERTLFEFVSETILLQNIQIINADILKWVALYFQFGIQTNQNHCQYKMTSKTIIRFILAEMALGKKQYSSYTFDEVLAQMVLVYMPAEAQITPAWLKQNSKQKQELLSCKYDYFIQIKGDKYIYYDYMSFESQISTRLKFLSAIKKRWKLIELKAIFRGIQSSENGKPMTLQDMLLKKFRKYGDQYEIKFVLPNK